MHLGMQQVMFMIHYPLLQCRKSGQFLIFTAEAERDKIDENKIPVKPAILHFLVSPELKLKLRWVNILLKESTDETFLVVGQ